MSTLIQTLEWDSNFFGMHIARLLPSAIASHQIDNVNRHCREEAVDVLYWLADPKHPGLGDTAFRCGFHFMDFRLDFRRQLISSGQTFTCKNPIRLCDANDVNTLARIASKSHSDSRFGLDPLLRTRHELLFEEWVRRDFRRSDGAFFVADRGNGACGYCTCQYSSAGEPVGKIGLVGVAADCQGLGLGKQLVQSAIDWLASVDCPAVSVVTQGSNIAAQSLYQSMGFKTHSSGVWFHRSTQPIPSRRVSRGA